MNCGDVLSISTLPRPGREPGSFAYGVATVPIQHHSGMSTGWSHGNKCMVPAVALSTWENPHVFTIRILMLLVVYICNNQKLNCTKVIVSTVKLKLNCTTVTVSIKFQDVPVLRKDSKKSAYIFEVSYSLAQTNEYIPREGAVFVL